MQNYTKIYTVKKTRTKKESGTENYLKKDAKNVNLKSETKESSFLAAKLKPRQTFEWFYWKKVYTVKKCTG
jgi:hypothetical protein